MTESSGIVISCSGGTDSTALFHLLRMQMEFTEGFPLKVLHFNFGLRGEESDEDQRFVEELGRNYGFEVLVHKVTPTERERREENNIQAWARSVRKEAFKQFTQKGWIIALAHQKDDLAENILLRMSRGVSPGSLMGMKEWHPPFWRPMLDIGREELLKWLNHYKFTYRHDSTNDKLVYSRNVVRHRVIPELRKLNAKARDHIVRCARETQDFVEFTRSSLLKVQEHRGNSLFDSETLRNLPKGVAYDVLSCGIGRPESKGINHRILEQALETIKRSSFSRKAKEVVQVPEGKSLILKAGKISLVETQAKTKHRCESSGDLRK